jgi:hypothetical protein
MKISPDAPSVGASRIAGHLFSFLVLWPIWSVSWAPGVLVSNPLFHGVDPAALRWGMAYTALTMWREFLAVGLLLALLTTAATAVLRPGRAPGRSTTASFVRGVADALFVALALLLGVALELPASLQHPSLGWAERLPVWAATAGLALLTIARPAARAWSARSLGAATRPAVVAVALVLLSWASVRARPEPSRAVARSEVRLVLGIDSVSRVFPVDGLKAFTTAFGGTWYERAVTPGLITNSVWSAIAAGRRPSELGVFFTFQAPDWSVLRPNLVTRARDAGLRTYSFFSDQFTTFVGSDLPFDENHSGPRGWKQVATAAVKDASWWLPTLLHWLPRLPGAVTPANQAGTYAFSLRRELHEIFTAGPERGGAFVAAHVDYLHQARYPGYSDLDGAERSRVVRAPLRAIRDMSLHWLYPKTEGEPLGVYAWKLAHLQSVLVSVAAETDFLSPTRRNALVLFSDHGDRSWLAEGGFGNEVLYGVLLATFGVPARDPAAPISLLDIGALVGLAPRDVPPAEPLVEYTNVVGGEWTTLLRTSRPRVDGGIELNPSIMEAVGARMSAFRPYASPPGYSPAQSRACVPQSSPEPSSVLALPR